MEQIYLKLEQFEGPLDLLLQLVSTHKVSIHDVSIHALIRQYLEIISNVQERSLEVRAEFLEMAARLVLIKTQSLLPKREKEEDPEEVLRQELLDYQDCKILADSLRELATEFTYYSRSPDEIPPDFTYRFTHDPQELLKALLAAVGKGARKRPLKEAIFSGILKRTFVSIHSRYAFLFQKLEQTPRKLYEILEESHNKSELVATFLAVLSLVNARRITAFDDGSTVILQLQPNKTTWRELEQE